MVRAVGVAIAVRDVRKSGAPCMARQKRFSVPCLGKVGAACRRRRARPKK